MSETTAWVAGSVQLGAARLTRVVEWVGPIRTVGELFPDASDALWVEDADVLTPWFWYPGTGGYRAVVQSWLVEVDGIMVLIDTGVGDGRDRPQVPALAHLQTGFDRVLQQAGATPDAVDVVVNTHVHYDHVGWNTHRVDGGWQPLFPRARYLVPASDVEYFDPGQVGRIRAPRTEDEARRFAGIRLVVEDSIQPVLAAGQLVPWRDQYEISEHLRLEVAPGHTPGSSVVRLTTEPGAVFVGDVLHSPMQILRPEIACAFDLNAEEAATTRARLLHEAAGSGDYLIPAHFGGAGGTRVRRQSSGFVPSGWLDLPPV